MKFPFSLLQVLMYGMEQAKAITDELIKAHALASMSTEDSRVGLYKRVSELFNALLSRGQERWHG